MKQNPTKCLSNSIAGNCSIISYFSNWIKSNTVFFMSLIIEQVEHNQTEPFNFVWFNFTQIVDYIQIIALIWSEKDWYVCICCRSNLISGYRGGSRILFRRGCTRLLLYFNTNKPHSFFFLQNTSCIRKPQVISGGVHTPCTLPLDPPLG